MYQPKFKEGDLLSCYDEDGGERKKFYARINRVYTEKNGVEEKNYRFYNLTSYTLRTHKVITRAYPWRCDTWDEVGKLLIKGSRKKKLELVFVLEEF